MKFKKLTIAVFVILMLTTILGIGVYACTSVMVGKDASWLGVSIYYLPKYR